MLKVAVEQGAAVEEGALIAVIEAMKMENEITAHKAGTVAELPIAVGASVATGDTLAVITSAAPRVVTPRLTGCSTRRIPGRLGLTGRPEPAAMHRAHVCSIPFEHLDPYRGAGVSLAPVVLERKLVAARRRRLLLRAQRAADGRAEALGLEVEPMLGRVRLGVPPETTNPLTHMLLRVRYGGELWHADVGFGRGTLLEPSRSARAGRTSSQAGGSAS